MMSKQRMIVLRLSCLSVVVFTGLVNEVAAQSFDSPQAIVLYEDDDRDYSVQAIQLYRGHLIVQNKSGGMLKTLLQVSAMTEEDLEAIYEAQSVARRDSRNDFETMNQGLMIAGTDQRILGISFDHQFMYVLVGGHAPEFFSDEDTEELESDARPVRIMLHAYDHRTSARHFSHEVLMSRELELGAASLGEGPLEPTETGVACFGWTFDFVEIDFVAAISPDGEESALPTVVASNRLRSL